jgi:hypothetical protein
MKQSIKLNGSEIGIGFEAVSPATAMNWLETTNTKNRPVKDSVVNQYARDMKGGRWQRTTTPIKFDADGVLLDGQHRLWAVVESQQTVEFLIARNVNPDERNVQDIGSRRTVADILSFEGRTVTGRAVSVANRLVESYQVGFKPTTQEQRNHYLAHHDPVDWVISLMPVRLRGIGQAGVLAPVARAWYSEDRERLARFLEVMRDGMPSGESENVIILLRNYALAVGQTKRNNWEVYGKCERALRAFLDGVQMKTLRAASDELFAIPSENGNGPKARRIPKSKVVKK